MQTIRNIIGLFQFRLLQPFYYMGAKFFLALMNYGIGVEKNGEEYLLERLGLYAKNTKKELTIFDVGANIGQYTGLVNKNITSKQLYSFEPSKKTFELLEANTRAFTNTHLFNFGLSHAPGVLTLYYGNGDAGGDDIHSCASLYPDNITSYITADTVSEDVKLRTLDDFCEENKISHIDFLKIDTEGHELSCLNGAKNMLKSNSIDMIQVELNRCAISSGVFLRDYWDLLSDNYYIYRMLSGTHGLYRVDAYETCLENFTFMNYIFIHKDSQLNNLYK